jgi:tRNA threonylcarbamoyladenosine biosynthesis protein TsaB
VRLLLDSSGPQLVCALADAEGVILSETHPTGTPESRDIGRVAGSVLGELLPTDLAQIVVGLGPGSFIGTRVAISYANGLAAGGGIPLRGVNSLAAIAAVHGEGRSVVLRDARRGEAYWYGPLGQASACRLVGLDGLARELTAQAIASVVVEQPSPAQPSRRDVAGELLAAASQAGAHVIRAEGVPPEGLRRLGASATPKDYVEPVYLRGVT